MSIAESLLPLRKNGRVYLHDSAVFEDQSWQLYQHREMAFWKHKITQTDYRPNPQQNFAPFLRHWQIGPEFFQGKTALELGSGPFGFFSAIRQMGQQYLPETLVVADPLMDFYQQFELAEMIPEQACLLQSPGEDLPFADGSFDLIVTTNTIDHVKDCRAFLAEIARLLKPGGRLLFSVHVVRPAISWLRPLLKMIDKNHPYHFIKPEVLELLHENGLHTAVQQHLPVIAEDQVPRELGLVNQLVYQIGYRLMATYYAVAVK